MKKKYGTKPDSHGDRKIKSYLNYLSNSIYNIAILHH